MAPLPEVTPIERIQENVLARAERRLLNWLCARMPRWVFPDLLSSVGMLGAVMILAGYLGSNWSREWLWLCVVGFAVHWFGDSLDGSLARFRKIERPRYGYFLDHSADAFGTTMIVGGIGLSPYLSLEAALPALIGYLMLSIHAFLSVRVFGELRLSYLALGPTEIRVILVALTLVMYFAGVAPAIYEGLNAYDLFALAAATLMIVLFVVQTVQKGRVLAREEPPRH
jgi:phosphatidylglycerophosphate synthase